jgi:hypothetical protein
MPYLPRENDAAAPKGSPSSTNNPQGRAMESPGIETEIEGLGKASRNGWDALMLSLHHDRPET